MKYRQVWLVVLCGTFLVACTEDKPQYEEKPAKELYENGEKLLAEKEYKEAGKAFTEVERQHPYSDYATKAQLNAAFSYYKAGAYDDAIVSASTFAQLHPAHEEVPYAYYLQAMSNYEQIENVERDQSIARKALDIFNEMAKRFPESKYTKDILTKRDLVIDHLAGQDMEVGRFYMQRKVYVAAINRFRNVAQNYQTTAHVSEALYRLVAIYITLRLDHEAQKVAAVLGHNFPGSYWYQEAYKLLSFKDLTPDELEYLENLPPEERNF